MREIVILVFTIFLVLVGAQNVFALTTVTFDDDGTFTTASIVESGVTVTGSNTLSIVQFNGIGVVGGTFDSTIDTGESVTFDFSGTATSVSYTLRSVFNGDADGLLGESQIEVFDSSDVSLGTQNVDGIGPHAVSALFGNVPISRFTVSPVDGDRIRINSVTFDLSQQLVGGILIPIDTTALLLVGTQITAAWLIPVIVAGAGIGLVLVRKK